MKYLLTLYGDESRFADLTPEQQAEGMQRWDAYTSDAIEAGVLVGGEGLQPSSTATTVQIPQSGDPIVSDGPFVETKEQLGGFYVIECASIDDALDWAAKLPSAERGATEIRPVMAYEEMGIEDTQRPVEAQS